MAPFKLAKKKKKSYYRNRKPGVMLLGKGLKPNPFTPSLGVWFYVKILESEVEI